ncbi:hypothetical protein A3860_38850 [Niastella vici]|uniref:Transposase n=1 Tax=Niastella vici TaxID=1703345 RepID=A0A1V9FLF4_9BACT|nr:transposase [Niastella vici]OQP59131.1 hypothetical protein A3860_38850 [Niastella vici]
MEQNQQQQAALKVRRSSQEILECLKEQRQGGLTVREYCQANAISEKTFYRWQKVYGKQRRKRRKKQSKARSGFATIDVIGNVVAAARPQLFAEIGNIRLYKEVPAEYLKTLLS